MGTKWTDEQKEAIKTRECNLLVAAAAGSGKTAVLVERIIKIVTNEEEPVDVDKLLVVTFTNAAAAEMRERIASAITAELEQNPNSKILQKQLTLLSRANITTMHSFCLDVIKNNFHIIDLDPSFRISDEAENTLLRNEIMDELFEDLYDEGNQDFLNLVEAFSNNKNDDELKNIVLNLYRFCMSGPWPKKWLYEKAEEFNISTIEELDKTKWINVLKREVLVEVESSIKLYTKAIDLINETEGLNPYLECFTLELSNLINLRESLANSFKDVVDALEGVVFGRIKTIKKGTTDDGVKEFVKKIRDGVKKQIEDLNKSIGSLSIENMLFGIKNSYPYMKKLSDVVLEFGKRFDERKREKNIIDFNDLEHMCLKILTDEDGNPSQIAMNFKEFFDEVLVDEYQDSNNVQEAIINLVSRKNGDNPNVFMVGDVKQSIYRFRQAKPELFLEKYNNYAKESGKRDRVIQLYKNFRSREEVIDGVNYIFKEVMSENVGELEYTDSEALNLGASYKEVDGDFTVGGAIELNILEKDSLIGGSLDEDEEKAEEDIASINLEARVVISRIKELINSDFKVLDKGTGEYRPLRYKDIVILLRATKNWSDTFLDEFGIEGIPAYADTGSGYFESIEIRTIMSLLKIIDNPLQDVPTIAVLRSPIFSFTGEELIDIRSLNKEKYFYDNILDISKGESKLSDDLVKKCTFFIDKLEIWREKSLYMPIDEFIWHLYIDTAYFGYVGAMPNGVLRQANLKVLFQRAKLYEATSFKGLFNFINFINKIRKSSGDMESAKILGENEDVVRIMSIHKSKGLEFPVVFLAGAGKNFNLRDLANNIMYHDELGFGPNYIDLEKRVKYTTLPKEAIKKKARLETISEEMRILYVAFTRAKEKLIIVGATKNLEKSASKWIKAASIDDSKIAPSEVVKGKSYLDWIAMAVCKHKDGEAIRNLVEDVGITSFGEKLSTWKVKLFNKREDFVEKVINNVDEIEKNNMGITLEEGPVDKEVEKRLGYKYKFDKITTMKSNFSVSDLKKANYDEVEDYKGESLFRDEIVIKPKFLVEKKGLSPAERGTAIHYIMQKIDYDKIGSLKDIKEQIDDMLERELISKEEFSAINPYKILGFFKSNIGKRVLKAYKDGNLVYRELPFFTEISAHLVNKEIDENTDEKVRLQGVIDLFFEENGEIILVDYKTDYLTEDYENDMIDKYRIQMDYYKDALEKITGKKVKSRYLYLFFKEEEMEI